MQSIRQYRKIQAHVSETLQRTDLSQGEKWIDVMSGSDGYKNGSGLGVLVPGVRVQNVDPENEAGSGALIVGWDGDNDPMNPHNWTLLRRWLVCNAYFYLNGLCFNIFG